MVIDENKYDYIFGVSKSSKHNASRSAHNLSQMDRLGIPNSSEGRKILENHLEFVINDNSNIIKRYANEYGSYEIRESFLAGPSGKFAKIESSFEVLPDGTRRLISMIPKGG
ncbi:MAG: hypothetical protein H6620_12670 [Halobacteriovoraceae bacterium]|nr:hypothetical protein [Halobacteriovoraceae bacterium]